MLVAPLYVMIPPASSAEILQAIGQTRPIAPKCTSPTLDLCQQDNIDPYVPGCSSLTNHYITSGAVD